MHVVAGDVSMPEMQDALLAAVPSVDILVNNNGGPPFRDFRTVDREALLAGVVGNMATSIELVQKVIDGMVERRFGRIVNITSSSVKMPLAGLDVSSGARVGLTGFLAGVARSVAHANVTINFLLPGAFDTRRLQSGQRLKAEKLGLPVETVTEQSREAIPARRFGDPRSLRRLAPFSVPLRLVTSQDKAFSSMAASIPASFRLIGRVALR